ncbi:M12 family metallo-peptidase [Ferruginibacter sp. SUN106]|uniref:M12 family metallo-peptidase n=1 Tax=Ferruginibacter sp. SUN106 TaxID=2978348 RepID=UPI003D35C930
MKKLVVISLLAIIGVHNFSCSKKDSTSTGLPAINSANDKQVGASANDLLSAANYTSVKIEIQYMPGFAPDAAAINNLTAFFNSLINKPGGITVVQSQIASANKVVLSLTDIATIEKNNRTVFTSGNQLGVYFLYTDGTYTESAVLGLAYRNTSMCILGKTVHDNSGSIGQASRTKLESTVIEHEAGHILGLVDIGSPMQTNHKDAAHGNHCSNTSCLMYYSSETTDVLGFLITGTIPLLDANCKADLHANGGK